MHGDISRTTFSERHAYRAVLLQQGRVVLDADFNEQADLTAHHDEVRTRDAVGPAGGPLPADASDPGPFAVLAADGTAPAGTAWTDLVVTGGRYYLDGAVVESFPPADGTGSGAESAAVPGWRLAEQPDGDGPPAQPFGTAPEPPTTAGTRVALYLEATDHTVTADEQPRLRESALGGPDTAVRRQTSWQVRWRALEDEVCSDLDEAFFSRRPRTMGAALAVVPAASDPCEITASGGYRRLENQLYRVQVHSVDGDGATAHVLWSRENGSVVARVLDLEVLATPARTARLALDREGRDPELDLAEGDLVELTSTSRQLRREPGFLGRITVTAGLDRTVQWLDAVPAALPAAADTSILRRWEGGPARIAGGGTATTVELEDGITVRFPAGGQPRVGDYWQVPARAVQLAYGLNAESGTIEWPPPGAPSTAVPPLGPISRIAPLGILEWTPGTDGEGDGGGEGGEAPGPGWTLVHDCRTLFPPLTRLTGLDLVGGDGQESLPGAWLDEPVRVVVRNGTQPVAGAAVRFTAGDGGVVAPADPAGTGTDPSGTAADVVARTGTDGVARAWWRLAAGGPVTQVLSVQRIDDHGAGTDVQVRATARLSVAAEVAFTQDGCEVFSGVRTVQQALSGLAGHPELRLHGGDGQEVRPGQLVLPQPVRVIVDSDCGPVAGDTVIARATAGGHVRVAGPGQDAPEDLSEEPQEVEAGTGEDGAALFWWQPGRWRDDEDRARDSDVLEIRRARDDRRAPIVVTAGWERAGEGGAAHPGAHIEGVTFGDETEFLNDGVYRPVDFGHGIQVRLDQDVDNDQYGQPVLWVELDLPWPVEGEAAPWGSVPVGTRTVKLAGDVAFDNQTVYWYPHGEVTEWMSSPNGLWAVQEVQGREQGILGRAVLEGWAIRTRQGMAVNTHTEMDVQEGQALHVFPSDDLVAGGTFVQWFHLRSPVVERFDMPDFTGMAIRTALVRAREIGFSNVRREPPTVLLGVVIEQDPEPGTPVTVDTPVVLRVEQLG